MKRFLSIFIAVMMLVCVFAATAVAFAEEPAPEEGGETEAKREVVFNIDQFKEIVAKEQSDFYLEMNRSFMFENKWWEDAENVYKIFANDDSNPDNDIRYRVQPKEELKDAEGNEKPSHTVHYNFNNPTEADAEGNLVVYTKDTRADEEKQETKHFTLPAAPEAETHKEDVPATTDGGSETAPEQKDVPNAYFAGWTISRYTKPVDGEDAPEATAEEELPVHLRGIFAARADIAMPDFDIEISAVWVPYTEENAEQTAKDMVKPDDKIYLLYVSPSGSTTQDMKDWSRCLVTSTLSLTTEGEWNFRFAVVDGEKASESGYSFDYDDVVATTFDAAQAKIDELGGTATEEKLNNAVKEVNGTLKYRVKDTVAPQIKLSTSQQNKVTEGLTVGTTYSISTSLDITDCSSTTVTYIVEKNTGKENGATVWTKIYDSSTREVAEGYEDNISTSGVITPLEEDVTGEDMYRITYTVVDSFGNHAVAAVGDDETPSTDEAHPIMLLKVKAADVETTENEPIEVWKIVLYVIAGLSAVGIVVLLCIKPKKQVAEDNRYVAKSDENTADDAQQSDNNDNVK